jgi:hypothetical protein
MKYNSQLNSKLQVLFSRFAEEVLLVVSEHNRETILSAPKVASISFDDWDGSWFTTINGKTYSRSRRRDLVKLIRSKGYAPKDMD